MPTLSVVMADDCDYNAQESQARGGCGPSSSHAGRAHHCMAVDELGIASICLTTHLDFFAALDATTGGRIVRAMTRDVLAATWEPDCET